MPRFQSHSSGNTSERLPYPLWKIIAVAVTIGVLCIIWLKKEIYHDQLARQVLNLEQEEDSLKNDIRTLNVEYGRLAEPTRIEKLARERLGMTFPNIVADTVWRPGTTDNANHKTMQDKTLKGAK